MKYPLNKLAALLSVHPRTVLRYIQGKHNVYWAQRFNPELDVQDVATAFSIPYEKLLRAVNGRDVILTRNQAADLLQIKVPCFRRRAYEPLVSKGKFLRFSRDQLARDNRRYIK